MVDHNNFFSQFKEEEYTERTLQAHLQHCTLVESDSTGRLSIEHGVNSRSSLLQLVHFDMCSGALLPDVMHDLLEGALQHVLQLLLAYCIEKKRYFTLPMLNAKIEAIELGYMEDIRPAYVDHLRHLRQNGKLHILCLMWLIMIMLFPCTASQTWALGRLLPLMIGTSVPLTDPCWRHYTSLLEIMRYVLAPDILPEEVAWLNILIVDFLTVFVQLYPEASVLPKMHYMVHIPRLILKLDEPACSMPVCMLYML